MFYIFNAENKCIGYCSAEPNLEDLATRNEYAVESDDSYSIGATFENETIVEPTVVVDYESLARTLRNSIRNKIDKYLLPASTINDILVTEEQKQTLIADSLALAAWPTTVGWPLVPLPELSPLLHSLITVPNWSYQ